MWKKLSVLVACTLVSVQGFAAGLYDELNDSQKTKLQNGESITVTEEVSGKPWPKVFVYLRIAATPEEATAVFADYNRQKQYLPDVKVSEVVNTVNKSTFDVKYELDLPWYVGDDRYTVRDTVTTYDHGAAYRVYWNMLGESRHSHTSVGDARFETLGTGTILRYYNLVHPKSSLAKTKKVREEGIRKTASTAKALRKRIELMVSDPNYKNLLRLELRALRKMVE